MRAGVILSMMLLLGGSCAHAQEQERKLVDRIMRPDTELANSNQGKTFGGGKTFGARSSNVKEFYVAPRYAPRTFATRPFAAKSHSAAGTKFATGEANAKGRYVIPNVGKRAPTKTVEVDHARESGKTMDTHAATTREFRGRGHSQAALDAANAPKEPMTIDQVRALLNKNK